MASNITLIRCESYDSALLSETLKRQFELLGGMGRFVRPGDRVLVKPNLIAPKSSKRAAQTDPLVILETVRLLKDFGVRPFVGDSPAWGSVQDCLDALGVAEKLKQIGVEFGPLGGPVRCVLPSDGTVVGISRRALEADVIINLPKFKAHQQLVATFAVKNMFGAVAGKWKAYWHFARGTSPDRFCRFLIDIYRILGPSLNIIDGVVAMDGPGPIRGRARPLGWIVGGADPIACEVVCCSLVGIQPLELPMIKAASEMGFGCWLDNDITILGDGPPHAPCGDFELPPLIPVRFSLPHVAGSIFRQAVMLAGGGRKKA